MTDSTQILDYLALNKERLRCEYHIIKIGLFGSMARNEQTRNSDIDLLVEFDEKTEDLYALKQMLKDEIQSVFKKPVDICREKYIKSFFKSQILSEVRYV
jgi:uncharacterized protein